MRNEDSPYLDVIVVGAGLSGICAAYYLQEELGDTDFAVLEARESLGGTWDLFRYPGIRSDSDMHTLGFGFHPWSDPKAIADGPAILDYLHETVETFGLDERIQYNKRVERVSWSTEDAEWTVTVADAATGTTRQYRCGFLWSCTGYYRYDRGHSPDFAGSEDFEGTIVHPQLWPEDLDYTGKNVVIIGSGATAVTLLPEMSKDAGHVTMLQRSPSYILSLPAEDRVSQAMKRLLGERIGSTLTRWKNVARLTFFYHFSRKFPDRVRRYIMGEARKKVGDALDVDTHLNPSYDPWDQRVCLVPDDDLFEAVKSGNAAIVTDHIDRFDEDGIMLQSGEHLEADIIVTATGLELMTAGGATIEVDGAEVEPGNSTLYKGCMLSGVPNAVLSVGYTNASWTLKCELISQYTCRLLDYMRKHDYDECRPTLPDGGLEEVPLIDFTSGYVQRAVDQLPKQGPRLPWKLYQNYFLDQVLFRGLPIDDRALKFR